MEYAIGFAAAIAVGLFASVIGFDKERSFYPVVLIVIATLYLLFAAIAGSAESFATEAIPATPICGDSCAWVPEDSVARGCRLSASRCL